MNNELDTPELETAIYEKTALNLGLTDKKVADKVAHGDVNIVHEEVGQTTKDIIFKYVFTIFNGLNATLLFLVLLAGKPLNSTFAFVILMNTSSGIFQELRAKKKLEKLTLLNTFPVEVLRNGKWKEIPVDAIVKDDLLRFKTGEQIVVDGVVRENKAEVNESLLTGEADGVAKSEGDAVFSGSFVSSGEIIVQALFVGDELYINRLASESKKHVYDKSPLQQSIDKIIKVIIYIMIPLGLILMFTQLRIPGVSWQDAIVGSIAGIVGMIPEGLVLLTTVAFLVGIAKLTKYKTLVQEVPAIEMLARTDVLCLDKTGTITEGRLEVVELTVVDESLRILTQQALGAISHKVPNANATAEAIAAHYQAVDWQMIEAYPFSSSTKWSGATFKDFGTWVVGAQEFVIPQISNELKQKLDEQASQGNRVLVICYSPNVIQDGLLPDELECRAIISLADVIRPHANTTIEYFKRQGVDLKIISGDNPLTVAKIAQKSGVSDTLKYIDARDLPSDMEELERVVERMNVFGRVTPEQKKTLVEALQANGHTVAMTGDGVNDILALKQADCSIAMASGSEASRSVAQIVLLDSDFASLPKIVDEGRKVVNNIERVASLYLIKSLYSIILSIISIVFMRSYPFIPIQLSLIGTLIVGMPTFFLALQSDTRKITGNFFEKVIQDTVPGALTIVALTVVTQIVADYLQLSPSERSTIAIAILGLVQFIILIRVSLPLRPKILLLFTCNFFVFVGSFFVGFIHKYLGFTKLPLYLYIYVLIMSAFSILLFSIIKIFVVKIYQKKSK